MNRNKPRALVLDGMWNKSLAAVRSFGRRGFFVAAGETTRFATALFSRYCSRRIVYPSPKEKPEDFLDRLETELSEYKYDVIFPMELSTQALLTSRRKRLSKYVRIPFAETDLCMRVQDKAFLMRYARDKKIDAPLTHIIDDIGQIEDIENGLDFPVVIKPRMSSGSRGIIYVKKKDDFNASYHRVHKNYPFPIVQEQIPKGGDAIGVCLLLNFESEVRASFVYRRLREYPVEGGPSTLREGIISDDVRMIAESLMKSLKWTGVAHVEFITDPRDGKPKLLEVNPRFWGSLHLAILSGVDFPWLLYSLAMNGDIRPVNNYKPGIRSRWLIPGDIMHFLINPDRFKLNPGFFSRGARDDIISFDDPMPTLGRISSLFPLIYKKEMRKLIL